MHAKPVVEEFTRQRIGEAEGDEGLNGWNLAIGIAKPDSRIMFQQMPGRCRLNSRPFTLMPDKTKKRFVVLQLTDLHLTDNDSDSRTEPRVLGALKGMNSRLRGILSGPHVESADLLLVTGDITDTGNLGSWSHFWNAISANGLLGKTRVVVGNHDVASLALFSRLRPRVDRSLRRARYMRGLRLGKASLAYPWCERHFANDLLICALRSTQEDNVTSLTNALGSIPKNQLSKLRRMLKDNSDAEYKVIALHHPPKFPIDGSVNPFLHDIRREDADALLHLCDEFRVQLIVHGHMHCFMDQRHNQTRIVGAAASTEPQKDSPHHVELCQYIFENGMISMERLNVPHGAT